MEINSKIINDNHYLIITIKHISLVYNLCNELQLGYLYNLIFILYNILYYSELGESYVSSTLAPNSNIFNVTIITGNSDIKGSEVHANLSIIDRSIGNSPSQITDIGISEIVDLAKMLYKSLSSTLYSNMLKNTPEYDSFIYRYGLLFQEEGE